MLRHGHTRNKNPTKIHSVWRGMLSRCSNPNNSSWKRYGGIGVKVCERWLRFENFLEDMGATYKEGLSIDRKLNGNYCPEDCRWATRKEQANNTKSNVWITHDGLRLTLAGWSEKTGRSQQNIKYRLDKGMSVGDALKPIEYLKDVARKNGIKYLRLYHLVRTRGMNVDDAVDKILSSAPR